MREMSCNKIEKHDTTHLPSQEDRPITLPLDSQNPQACNFVFSLPLIYNTNMCNSKALLHLHRDSQLPFINGSSLNLLYLVSNLGEKLNNDERNIHSGTAQHPRRDYA